jgi:hypothetical protein
MVALAVIAVIGTERLTRNSDVLEHDVYPLPNVKFQSMRQPTNRPPLQIAPHGVAQ